MLLRWYCVAAAIVLLPMAQQQSPSSVNSKDYDRSLGKKPVIIRLQPQPNRPAFIRVPTTGASEPTTQPPVVHQKRPPPPPPPPLAAPAPQLPHHQAGAPSRFQPPVAAHPPAPAAARLPSSFGSASALPPPPNDIQQALLEAAANSNSSGQQFVPRNGPPTPPPAPPLNVPPDVQNQLIRFFGLDSFGIPGLTGTHPAGFAGAIQELRASGIPTAGLPLSHIAASPPFNRMHAAPGFEPPADLLSQANPAFTNQFQQLYQETQGAGTNFAAGSQPPLPAAQPGENGLIGLLSQSIRRLVQDTGVADAIAQGLPGVIGQSKDAANGGELISASSIDEAGVRRQPTAAQRAISGLAAALGGGGSNSPAHAGLPRIPGLPLLPGGIPRNSQGQIDVVQLIGAITRRISNGTTLSDVFPPEQLQTLADNVTDALLPTTPEDFDLSKFMGINSPRATEQRCVVHHYGGLTNNDKTATFTALKIYREGSEFGAVRYSIGYAFRGGNKDAMLQMHSSETADAQPFWIYKLGPEGQDPFGNPQYEWAIVSNWVKYPVTVLVRDPDKFKTKYEVEVLRWLEDQGFINGFIRAFNLLQPAGYSSCQYADSTFEVFG